MAAMGKPAASVFAALLLLLLLLLATSSQTEDIAIEQDDECESGSGEDACALSALQHRGVQLMSRARMGSSGELATITVREFLSPWKVSKPSKKESEILDIINEEFGSVKGHGTSWSSSVMEDETWQNCGAVDWSSPDVTNSKLYQDGEAQLGIISKCKRIEPMDSLCASIAAFANSMRRLSKQFPEGPKFYNAFVTNWGEYNSWTKNAVGEVNYTARPPSAKVSDPNGVIEYAICDIVREVLTQSPKQYAAGVCSHTATLDALATQAPAKLFEMAVRLLWTGRHSTHEEHPCSYVYERQPGLVPWQNGDGTWVPKEATEAMRTAAECTGNAVDCAQAAGQPAQPIGLAFMWEAAATSEIDTSHGGSCKGREVNELNYPGVSKDEAAVISDEQSGNAASMLWACRHFTDPKGDSCRFRFNKAACNDLPFEACASFSTTTLPKLYKDKVLAFATNDTILPVLKVVAEAFDSQSTASSINAMIPENASIAWKELWGKDSHGRRTSEKILNRMGNGTMWGAIFLLLADTNAVAFFDGAPSATEELLSEACEAKVATLLIASNPLQFLEYLDRQDVTFHLQKPFFGSNLTAEDLGIDIDRFNETTDPDLVTAQNIVKTMTADSYMPYGLCNHAVYLNKCDAERNEYTLWSWGKHYTVPREVLLGQPVDVPGAETSGVFNSGMICGAILADRVSWAEVDRSA